MALTTYTAGEVLTAASLNDNFTFAAANPISKIVQVVSTTLTTTYTMSSTSYATITSLTATITPTLDTSKILVIGTLSAVGNTGVSRATSRLIRDSTAIGVGTSASSRVAGTAAIPISGATGDIYSMGLTFLDSPASTSALVYGIQVRVNDSGTVYVNRSENDSDNSSYSRPICTITVMEILA